MLHSIAQLPNKVKRLLSADAPVAVTGQWVNAIVRQLLSLVVCVFLGATAAQAQFLGDGGGEIDLEFPPIAIAGDDQVVSVGDTVRLDGSASNDDADAGTIEAYDWSLKTILANNDRAAFIPETRAYFRSLSIIDADTATPSLILPTLPAGIFEVDLVIDLVVTDAVGLTSWASDGSEVMITVLADVPDAPSSIITTEASGEVSVSFEIADNGGTPVTDIQYRLNGGTWQSTGSAAYAFSLSGLDAMSSHTLEIRAENAAGISSASSAKTFTLQNPRTAFEEVQSAYVSALRDHAVRSLQREQASARRVVQSARDRLAESLTNKNAIDNVTRFSTTYGVGGVGEYGGVSFAPFAAGETFASLSVEGSASGSSARVANFSLVREFSPSSETRWGVMLRAAASGEDASGTFSGSITSKMASLGLYGVTSVGDALFLDGFMVAGRSRQSVALRTNSINIASNYWTTNTLAGLSLSGSHSAGQFTLLPALSATVARGQIGAIKSDVSGFDLAAKDILTDLGSVWYSEIAVSPEIRRNFSTDGAGYIAFIPQWSCADSNTAMLRDECHASAEIKLQLENVTSGQTLMLSIMREDLRPQGTSTLAAEFSVQF